VRVRRIARTVLLYSIGLFLLGQTAFLFGQDDTTTSTGRAPVISGFAVFGNKVTQPETILREITLQVGDTIDLEEIEFAKSRIYSLGLFNRVDITWPPMDSTILLVEVDERWFLYPVPLFGIVDRNWDHWYYGMGVKHENFRGRNEKIFAGFVLGYNPWVSLSYSNPWIFGDDQLFTETGFAWSKVVNKSMESRGEGPNFDEIHYSVAQMLGKRLDTYRSIWLHAAYNYIEVTENRTGRTINDQGVDRYLSLGFGASHDTRNLREYPTSGIYGTLYVAKKGFGIGFVDMMTYQADVRIYKPLYKNLSLAMRAFTRLSSGPSIPNYEHHFLGFSERIRGHFFDEIEGENSMGAFVELRIPIVPNLYIHVPQMPIRQFATWKLGLYAALFGDIGTVWDKDERPEFADMPRGYGAGLHFLLPYGIVFRIDRAWAENRAGQWVFDVGVAF
jgi:outer membrane protein assembly factor BamA